MVNIKKIKLNNNLIFFIIVIIICIFLIKKKLQKYWYNIPNIILVCILILYILNLIDFNEIKLNFILPDNDEIIIIDDFLQDNQIESIINDSNKYLKDSKVENNNISKIDNNIRKSKTAFLNKSNNKYIKLLRNQLQNKFNFKNIDIQYLYYNNDGFYKPHLDAFENKNEKDNRKYSILVYLNTPIEGATYFTKMNKRIKAKKGKAIVWKNLKNGLPDKNSEHTGEKVVGEKYCLNIWLT